MSDKSGTNNATGEPVDLYRDVHKGLRLALFELTSAAGALDGTDHVAIIAFAGLFADIDMMLEAHHGHEDGELLGSLIEGFGLGWSTDEYQVTGTPWTGRAKRVEDALDVIDKIWGGGTVAHESPYTSLPESVFEAMPVQKPRPPLYLAAAKERDLDEIGLIVRANCSIVDETPEADRQVFSGSVEQIIEDVHQCAEIGADVVFIEVQYSPGMDSKDAYMEYLETFAQLASV